MGKESKVLITDNGLEVPVTNVMQRVVVRYLGKPICYSAATLAGGSRQELNKVLTAMDALKHGFDIETGHKKGLIQGTIVPESDPRFQRKALLDQANDLRTTAALLKLP